MGTKMCNSKTSAVIMIGLSFLMFIFSVVMLLVFPTIYNIVLHKQLSLVNNSMEFDIWRDLPITIYERLYFFNITNAEEFLAKKEKLKVSQVGPYTYRADWKKHFIAWHPNKTVTYQELRTYHFYPEESDGTQDDMIYTFNGPLIVATNFLKNEPIPLKILASLFFGYEGEKLIIKKSIRELVYEGYYDPIINDGRYIMPNLPFQNGMFAWLTGKNATYDGQFTVFTGEDDIKKLNIINNWNGENMLPYWKGDSCNMMNGSSGETNPPLDDNQDEVSFFQSFFCRTVTFKYNGTDASHFGFKTKRFYATNKIFANGSDNPENTCFDTTSGIRSGLLDLSSCQFGAPVFLSFPHFYMADPYYANAVIGLNSTNEDFLSYIDIDPVTGASMGLTLGFQLNVQIIEVPYITQVKNVPEGFFPILWAEIKVAIPDKLGNMLRNRVVMPKIIVYTILGICFLGAIILFIAGMIVLYKLNQKNGSEEDDKEAIVDENKY